MLAAALFTALTAVAGVSAHPAFQKRMSGASGRGTFYNMNGNAGSCGIYNNDGQYLVALNSAQYMADISSNGWQSNTCGKCILVTANGKSARAVIQDQCPTCDYGDIDLSPALFHVFAEESVGVIQVTWDYVDCIGDELTNGGNEGSGNAAPTTQTTQTTTQTTQTTTQTQPTETPVASSTIGGVLAADPISESTTESTTTATADAGADSAAPTADAAASAGPTADAAASATPQAQAPPKKCNRRRAQF